MPVQAVPEPSPELLSLAVGLRRAAEIHLVTYSAMQAIRFGRYRDAFTYLAMIGRRSVKSLPRAVIRVALARFGI